MPKKDLAKLIEDMDYPDDVADYVRTEVQKGGNEARILSGELVLPSRQDAIHAHDRLQGRFGLNEDQRVLEKRIQELEARLKGKAEPEGEQEWPSQPSSTPTAP